MMDSRFEIMSFIVDKKFHYLTDNQRRFIKNKVSNIIRRAKHDVYNVWVDKEPICYAQYAANYEFDVGKHKVYVHIQVD